MKHFQNDWAQFLEPEMEKDYYLELRKKLSFEYKRYKVFPDMYDIFQALDLTSYSDTKVVILGQDPYHEPGQAHGLSFSVKPDVGIPPSLENIFAELKSDLGCYIPNNGYLKSWADQGVLLLNTVLTVRAHAANSHKDILGWEIFTDQIIRILNARKKPIAFILWGKNAQSKKSLITNSKHLILESPHPSPLSAFRGFFGSKPFSKVNEFLKSNHMSEIDWQIKNI